MQKSIPQPAAWIALVVCAGFIAYLSMPAAYADPPAMNPFAPRETVRDDAVPGYVELSDGKIHYGMIHLTRDKRLKINDDKIGRQREVPLRVVTQIDGIVKKEWMEKEWRFKELSLDEKMFTGRQYPARDHLHEITLRDGRKIKGPLAAIIYLKPGHATPDKKSPHTNRAKMKTARFTLYKRTKGKPGTKLKDLVYVKRIKLGEKALQEGRRKARKKSTKIREQ